jgi:hypothetical protein
MKKIFCIAAVTLIIIFFLVIYYQKYADIQKKMDIQPFHPVERKALLLTQIDEYERELSSRALKENCSDPKKADTYICMYGNVSNISDLFRSRYKEFRAYWNCRGDLSGTVPCTLVMVMPKPKNMRESVERYIKFCTQKPESKTCQLSQDVPVPG